MNKAKDNNTGLTIARLRKQTGLTQSQLAKKLLVSDKAISRWESGVGLPEVANLVALSEVFGVSVDYIIKGKGEQQTMTENNNNLNQKDVSNSAILSLVLGGVGILATFVVGSIVGLILGIIALVVAKNAKKETNITEKSANLLNIAVIVSIVATALAGLMLVIGIIALIFVGSMAGSFFDMFNSAVEQQGDFFNNFGAITHLIK